MLAAAWNNVPEGHGQLIETLLNAAASHQATYVNMEDKVTTFTLNLGMSGDPITLSLGWRWFEHFCVLVQENRGSGGSCERKSE